MADGGSRLDRIEGILERLADRLDRMADRMDRLAETQEQQREEFDREHKLLLQAQVVLTDRVDKLTIAQAGTTDKLNGLIDLLSRHLTEGDHAR